MDSWLGSPGIRGLKTTLIAGLTLLTTDALLAQSADQNDVNALKAQMNQMQKQYEKRIETMEAKMKALEATETNGSSILNTRILTDSDGKAMEGKGPGPMLDESFLKSLTRNFAFTAYLRAGFGVNGSGGGQTFSFVPNDNFLDGGRSRLGNESDIYMELSYQQNHILGDSPDVMDVSARFTAQYFSTVRSNALNTSPNKTTTRINGVAVVNGVSANAGVGIIEAFVLAKNIFKGAPEIGVWAGDRFYDRWNIDSMDWFWLNMSGIGYGFQDIPLGPGKLWVAWFGGNDNNGVFNYPTVGQLFKQSLDIRWKDVDIGFGKLTPFVIGSFIKGGTTFGSPQEFTDVLGNRRSYGLRTDDMWGVGGGMVWEYEFGNKSRLRVVGMGAKGATDFHSDPSNQENEIIDGFQHALDRQALLGNPIPATLKFHNPVNDAIEAKAIVEFIWNPTPNFNMGAWAMYEYNDHGTSIFGTDNKGRIKEISGTRNIVAVGMRPVFWLTDTFCIQGQFVGYYGDNNRGSQSGAFQHTASGVGAFGRSGEMGVFTIAPTFKPKGGFFTRPEFRLFATLSVWSDSWKTTTTGGAAPYNNANANYGWMFGSQTEIWW
jgi:maltoporin